MRPAESRASGLEKTTGDACGERAPGGAHPAGAITSTLIPLVECHLLDPRPADEAAARPIHDAVNIALAELPRRTHELPPRGETIPVAGPPDLVARTVAWLTGNGRAAVAAAECAYESAPSAAHMGRLWRPSAFLAEILPQLRAGAALDVACGTGRDAVHLASCGWAVTAVDVLPDALARAWDLAQRCAAAIRPIRWMERDLENGGPGWEQRFDLITIFRYLHRPLLARLGEWLAPGGSVLYETFTAAHRARHGKPARAVHVLEPGELPELLAGLEMRQYSEAWRGADHTARVWATAPGGG